MQTKKQSLIEAITNTLAGLGIATLCNQIVLPLFGYPVSIGDSLGIAIIFTLISVIRNYVIRRFFACNSKK